MRVWGWTTLLCGCLTAGLPVAAQEVEPELRLGFDVGPALHGRTLDWSIGSADGPGSRLTYRKLGTSEATVSGRVDVVTHDRWGVSFFADGLAGRILSGTAQDSDYASRDGIVTEVTRFTSDVTGSSYMSTLGGVGVGFKLPRNRVLDELAVEAGFERISIALRKRNGRQVIPFSREVPDLDSWYRARWKGGWAGGKSVRSFGRGEISLAGRLHWDTSYRARGEWNLRDDLMQPTSFSHRGDGQGYDVRLRYSRPLGDDFRVGFEVSRSNRHLTGGWDTLYRADGSVAHSNLAEVTQGGTGFRIMFGTGG